MNPWLAFDAEVDVIAIRLRQIFRNHEDMTQGQAVRERKGGRGNHESALEKDYMYYCSGSCSYLEWLEVS